MHLAYLWVGSQTVQTLCTLHAAWEVRLATMDPCYPMWMSLCFGGSGKAAMETKPPLWKNSPKGEHVLQFFSLESQFFIYATHLSVTLLDSLAWPRDTICNGVGKGQLGLPGTVGLSRGKVELFPTGCCLTTSCCHALTHSHCFTHTVAAFISSVLGYKPVFPEVCSKSPVSLRSAFSWAYKWIITIHIYDGEEELQLETRLRIKLVLPPAMFSPGPCC